MRSSSHLRAVAGFLAMLACFVDPAARVVHAVAHAHEAEHLAHFGVAHTGSADQPAALDLPDADSDHDALHQAAVTGRPAAHAEALTFAEPAAPIVLSSLDVASGTPVALPDRTGSPPTAKRQPSQPRAPPIG